SSDVCSSDLAQHDDQIGEIHPADDDAQRRHDHVLDEGGHDLAEGGADDDADGHVHDIAANREGLELAHEAHGAFPPKGKGGNCGIAKPKPSRNMKCDYCRLGEFLMATRHYAAQAAPC